MIQIACGYPRKMFEDVIYELIHEPFIKESKGLKGSAFRLTNAEANVCAFLDCYFKGILFGM